MRLDNGQIRLMHTCYNQPMQALTFWKTITMDRADLLEKLISLLAELKISFMLSAGRRLMPMCNH
jgi:hypothetical protein